METGAKPGAKWGAPNEEIPAKAAELGVTPNDKPAGAARVELTAVVPGTAPPLELAHPELNGAGGVTGMVGAPNDNAVSGAALVVAFLAVGAAVEAPMENPPLSPPPNENAPLEAVPSAGVDVGFDDPPAYVRERMKPPVAVGPAGRGVLCLFADHRLHVPKFNPDIRNQLFETR